MTEFERLIRRIEALERRMKGMLRQGTVAEVDPAAGTVRLKLGQGAEGEYLSAPIPYTQTAGAMKFHNPPSVGQQMSAISPDGDLRNAMAMPLGWSGENASPSGAGDAHVMTFGAVTITIGTGSVTLTCGGSTIAMTAETITLSSGRIDLN
jgi:phage baseplate assembly protein V